MKSKKCTKCTKCKGKGLIEDRSIVKGVGLLVKCGNCGGTGKKKGSK